jgi:hypothetical protein
MKSHDNSNPAPALIAYKSFSFNVDALLWEWKK